METVKRRLYPVEEAAVQLGIGRSTVYGLIANGDLAATKIGARRLITAESLEAYIEQLTAKVV